MYLKRNRKKLTGIILCSLLIVLLVCLWQKENKQDQLVYTLLDSNVYTEFDDTCKAVPKSMDWIPDENTIEYGVLNENGISESDTKISLKSGEKYHKYISLQQHIEEKGDYSLIIFDNFRQISFLVDGKEMNHCTVSLEYGEEIMVPVTIEDLEDGYHKLIFIWLLEINRSMEEKELEEQSNYPVSCCLWADVEIGSGQWEPEYVTYEGQYFEGCNMLVNLQSQYGVDDKTEYIVHREAEHKELFATVGNNSDEEISKKILWAICDFEQIPIDDKGHYCMYVEVPKKKFISQAIPIGKKTDKLNNYQVFIMDLENGEVDCSGRVLVER